jgi:hypothetical protein
MENPFVNRFHLSIKTEMHSWLALIDNHRIRDHCIYYQHFYHKNRPHQGIGGVIQGIEGVIPAFTNNRNENELQIENLKFTKSLELNG